MVESRMQNSYLVHSLASCKASKQSDRFSDELLAAILVLMTLEHTAWLQTTGMDPVTRRHVWDIIESSKKGRAIVLTTHSMEEADILGDRIAIMARGRLRCIGTSIHLKTRFGAGYIVNVSVRKESVGNSPIMPASSPRGEELRRDEVKQFFKDVSIWYQEQCMSEFLLTRIWRTCQNKA